MIQQHGVECSHGAPDGKRGHGDQDPEDNDVREKEEIEAGYDTLIEMQSDEGRKYLERKTGISDKAIATHSRMLPALVKCPTEITVNRTHHGG